MALNIKHLAIIKLFIYRDLDKSNNLKLWEER